MKYLPIVLSLLLAGCSDSGEKWRSGDYVVYWIDNTNERVLGYDVGDGAFIKRIDAKVKSVGANEGYISVVSCQETKCSYFYIDRKIDHKYADSHESVSGPFNEEQFKSKSTELGLPTLSVEI